MILFLPRARPEIHMAELNQETINAKLLGMLSGQDRGTTADITDFALAYWDGAAVRYLLARSTSTSTLPISKLTNGTIIWSHGLPIRASRKSVPNLSNGWIGLLSFHGRSPRRI